VGRGREDTPILPGELDTHDASVLTGLDPAGTMALGLALAVQAVGGGRATVLEGVTIGFEPLEGQVTLLAGGRTEAMNTALLGIHDRIGALGVQWSGNGLARVVVRCLAFFTPECPGIDQGTDTVVVPQQGLGLAAVQSPVCAEVSASRSRDAETPPRQGGLPHGADWIIIPTLAAHDLQVLNDLLIREMITNQDKTIEVRAGLYVLPGKQVFLPQISFVGSSG